ncbi:hypothetical protein KCU81_g411, partial [Aureobasidium melanogenum]
MLHLLRNSNLDLHRDLHHRHPILVSNDRNLSSALQSLLRQQQPQLEAVYALLQRLAAMARSMTRLFCGMVVKHTTSRAWHLFGSAASTAIPIRSTAINLGPISQRDFIVTGEYRLVVIQSVRPQTPSKSLFAQATAGVSNGPSIFDQQLLERGELDLGGMDRLLDGMSSKTNGFANKKRVGFAECWNQGEREKNHDNKYPQDPKKVLTKPRVARWSIDIFKSHDPCSVFHANPPRYLVRRGIDG